LGFVWFSFGFPWVFLGFACCSLVLLGVPWLGRRVGLNSARDQPALLNSFGFLWFSWARKNRGKQAKPKKNKGKPSKTKGSQRKPKEHQTKRKKNQQN